MQHVSLIQKKEKSFLKKSGFLHGTAKLS